MYVRWNDNKVLVLQFMLIDTQDYLLLCCVLEISLSWRSVTIRPGDSGKSNRACANCPKMYCVPQFINTLPISAWTAHDPYIPYDQRLSQLSVKCSNTCDHITFVYFIHRLV